MALMFPRVARNFARNGYYPTDELTLARTLQALAPSPGTMRIIDPCAGEGVAIAECAHALGREQVTSYAVEYHQERAAHARTLVDHALRADFNDTVITRKCFGLLWLNPPYGDLSSTEESAYEGNGRKRLEKLFYRRTVPLLQYGGVLVFIIPFTSLDKELSGWLSRHFTDLRIYKAPEQQFRQVVIFGVRSRSNDLGSEAVTAIRDRLTDIGTGTVQPEELPEEWLLDPYTVPSEQKEVAHFYRISMEPEQFALEMQRLGGLWSDSVSVFTQAGTLAARRPARALSPWHLALSLAAGAISGVISSATGKTLVVKGNTYKEKTRKVEMTEDEDGNITTVQTALDRFVPVIKAWDMSPGSDTLGCVLTISSGNTRTETHSGDVAVAERPLFDPGMMVTTRGVDNAIQSGRLNPTPYIQRHLAGDWGDLAEEDRQLNMQALKHGDRLLSSYELDESFDTSYGHDQKLWIITEADRSVTTLLFPSEY